MLRPRYRRCRPMPEAACRTVTLLCTLVAACPVGTNLGLLHLLRMLARWAAAVAGEDRWQPHDHGGYRPVAVDVTAFWRPRLRTCPTAHDHGAAGRAPRAIPLGLVTRVGNAGGQAAGAAPRLGARRPGRSLPGLSWPCTLSTVRSWHSRAGTARQSGWME